MAAKRVRRSGTPASGRPPMCGGCYTYLTGEERTALQQAIGQSKRYAHSCGRVLFGSALPE